VRTLQRSLFCVLRFPVISNTLTTAMGKSDLEATCFTELLFLHPLLTFFSSSSFFSLPSPPPPPPPSPPPPPFGLFGGFSNHDLPDLHPLTSSIELKCFVAKLFDKISTVFSPIFFIPSDFYINRQKTVLPAFQKCFLNFDEYLTSLSF
jgi:hypothetical protein